MSELRNLAPLSTVELLALMNEAAEELRRRRLGPGRSAPATGAVRRWTLNWSDTRPVDRGRIANITGPVVVDPVDVVPAGLLTVAVEALERLAEPNHRARAEEAALLQDEVMGIAVDALKRIGES